jgi:F-type H+-transporting ATPase subunit epsilon
MNSIKLKLIAPDGIKYDNEVTSVSLPTQNGQITILPEHTPLIAIMKPGEIVIKINGKEEILASEGGVVEVSDKLVKILADSAEEVNSLNQLKIEEAKQEAHELLANAKNDVEYANAVAHLEKQIAKLNILKRRKKYR